MWRRVSDAAHHLAQASKDGVANDVLRRHQEIVTSSIDLQAGGNSSVSSSNVERGQKAQQHNGFGRHLVRPHLPKADKLCDVCSAGVSVSEGTVTQGMAGACQGHLGSVRAKTKSRHSKASIKNICTGRCTVHEMLPGRLQAPSWLL